MRVALRAVPEAVVVATRAALIWRYVLALSMPLLASQAFSAVIPEDRTDVMYHSYSGGGVTIDGPSILVRKGFKEKFSLSANYYVDNVSSASIDVQLSASEYQEKRTEKSIGFDYLENKALLSFSMTQSEENDYDAESFHFNLSQDFFGDLSTLSLGYSRGSDKVFRNDDDEFSREVDRQHYRFGFSQILTRNAIMSLNYEGISDEGFLNNPYRQVRFVDPADPNNFRLEAEVYPNTRTSDALALGVMVYLPYRASFKFKARYYTDDWGIDANTVELGYIHPLGERWVIDSHYRYYDQTAAQFFSDLFPRADFQDFKARDKELSTFSSHALGVGIRYEQKIKRFKVLERASVNLSVDHIRFDYEDFRDATASQNSTEIAAGEEPFYSFSANVVRFFISIFY